jgi:isocitrate dehydrogenase kinase/phosphatase
MPVRPRGEHYSTIGYNHVGKLVVMEQITSGLDANNETLDHAPGPPGSVAIGFNKDLDGRNYGFSSLRFVYLFDYDAVEVLTDVKVRTNTDMEDGEEGIPDWYFEDGTIFLPEELEAHLRLPDQGLRRLFREAHGELLGVDYWTRMQSLLSEGHVPRVRTYPRTTQLSLERDEANLRLTPQS